MVSCGFVEAHRPLAAGAPFSIAHMSGGEQLGVTKPHGAPRRNNHDVFADLINPDHLSRIHVLFKRLDPLWY